MSVFRRFVSIVLLLFVGAGAGVGFGEEPAKLPPKENFHLFLLVGQSNMAGRGKVEDQDRQPHPRVVMLDKHDRWVPAIDPMHFDKPGIVGVGLGRTFGIEIAKAKPDVTVGLIPCAVGGSPIDSWKPGGYHPQTKSHPWDDALPRAKLAMQSGVLKGILWHQGESDSQPGLAEPYETKLHDLVARFRKELGAADVPFIAGQMGQFAERPWSDAKKQVDAAHRELPKKVPHAAFVDSNGLSHKGDKVHFDTKSYRELGRRYAKAYLALTEANDDRSQPPGDEGVLADGAEVKQLADGFKFTEGPACDAAGNVYFTDQPNDRILRWSTDGELTTFMQPCGRSNGLCFDADGNLWACADEKNELWRIAPDGMTIDNEGNVYLTGRGVTVFDADGERIQHIPVNAGWTANVCFGGKHRQRLFITAKEYLFAVRTRVRGVGSQ